MPQAEIADNFKFQFSILILISIFAANYETNPTYIYTPCCRFADRTGTVQPYTTS